MAIGSVRNVPRIRSRCPSGEIHLPFHFIADLDGFRALLQINRSRIPKTNTEVSKEWIRLPRRVEGVLSRVFGICLGQNWAKISTFTQIQNEEERERTGHNTFFGSFLRLSFRTWKKWSNFFFQVSSISVLAIFSNGGQSMASVLEHWLRSFQPI